PVVTGNIDPAALEDLITACAQYHRLRAQAAADSPDAAGGAPGSTASPQDAAAHDAADAAGLRGGTAAPAALAGRGETAGHDQGGTVAEVLAMLEHQILGQVIQVVSGPGGIASFLRRHLLGKPLGGPSLPLDVGQSDDIPAHLRRLVALRDQTCQFPGGCDQPASGCEPHHVIHRADGGPTSLANLKDYCWWHHHVVLHQLGWQLTVHPDGTSQVQSPDGKIIRSHSPPPRPG
ncbi:MAG: HNH endonuclease, partial [Actinobacteria bacterium]|nr:HNH endonuclease [Actinomycetota bacterium]